MSTPVDSQQLESFVPVYDAVPEKWEDARQFLVEHLKKISNAVNIREIGWFLDEELLSGKAFIPGATIPGNNPGTFRQVLRKVIDFSPLVVGANTKPHGITFDANFSLVQLYAAATDAVAFTAIPIPNTVPAASITMNATNIIITSPAAYTRSWAVLEYLQEL